ncbi:hypothetical protein [Parasediminibacterium sp. JCM 36343]|uniref:hypothetical protein n=1 Tax=Parasediminibacterium sp. JCM 36343 TaxID=3374279 RepID=UPI00397E5E97
MYVSDTDKKNFASIILLDEILNKDSVFATSLEPADKVLEPLLIELLGKSYLSVAGGKYAITDKGKQAFDVFMQRYTEALKLYDIFAFVDLEKGEFAFSRYFDFDNDQEWDIFKSESRFEDLRIAVAMFKKLNPAEIVFMSFINENRFDTQSTGWQFDLVSNAIWDEIEEICATAIKPADLGDDAMKDMVAQGSALLINILKEEAAHNKEQQEYEYANNQSNNVVETVVEETSYYEPYYYDPYYVSPFWLVPLFLW